MSVDGGMDAGGGAMKGPPPGPADPVERLLREWPELGVFGVDWLRTWAPYARRQIAGIARRADIPGWRS